MKSSVLLRGWQPQSHEDLRCYQNAIELHIRVRLYCAWRKPSTSSSGSPMSPLFRSKIGSHCSSIAKPSSAKINGSSAPDLSPRLEPPTWGQPGQSNKPVPAANRIRLTVSCEAVDIHCDERSFHVDLLAVAPTRCGSGADRSLQWLRCLGFGDRPPRRLARSFSFSTSHHETGCRHPKAGRAGKHSKSALQAPGGGPPPYSRQLGTTRRLKPTCD